MRQVHKKETGTAERAAMPTGPQHHHCGRYDPVRGRQRIPGSFSFPLVMMIAATRMELVGDIAHRGTAAAGHYVWIRRHGNELYEHDDANQPRMITTAQVGQWRHGQNVSTREILGDTVDTFFNKCFEKARRPPLRFLCNSAVEQKTLKHFFFKHRGIVHKSYRINLIGSASHQIIEPPIIELDI